MLDNVYLDIMCDVTYLPYDVALENNYLTLPN